MTFQPTQQEKPRTLRELGRGVRRRGTRATLLLVGLVSIWSCKDEQNALATTTADESQPRLAPTLAPTPTAVPTPTVDVDALFASALAESELPGAPDFEKHRAAMVARAKSEPVFFVRAPRFGETDSATVRVLRQRFLNTDFPWRELGSLKRRLERAPEMLREVILPEGYLYADKPDHAFALVSRIRPAHLFDEKHLWVHRGSWLMHAERREKGHYYFLDGPEIGKRVRLLHLDRIGTGAVPEPLHRDFRRLRYQLFFDRARVTHIGTEHLIAELRYGTDWIPTVLRSEGSNLSLVAERIDAGVSGAVQQARGRLEKRARAVDVLRAAMQAQIDEALPFDEPKTEIEQQDGALRPEWSHAYARGRNWYRFNDDRYDVYDEAGRPRPPQVCIDFMVDTLERASGNWYRPRDGGPRDRTLGKLDLRGEHGDRMRRTKGFVSFAVEHPEWFDVLKFPEHTRIEMGYKPRFFRWLAKQADHFEPGDLVFIRGLTPWDEIDEHTHSFFIYETDPLTGIPIAIAGNAGPANLWSWETEARRTPNRTLRERIRLRIEWLESILPIDAREQLTPPVLVSGKK